MSVSAPCHATEQLVRGGLLVVNKPIDALSRAFSARTAHAFVFNQTKYRFERESILNKRGVVKAGHFGTLDPFASGLLPVAIGNATKLANHLPLEPKRYVAQVQLGVSTDTGDCTGEVSDTRPVPRLPSRRELERMVKKRFLGKVRQTPPRYSAIHINGTRAYELARRDKKFEMPSRLVHIHGIKCRILQPDLLELDVTCGSGTYIRTLGMDIAEALGTCGHLTALKRESVGPFLSSSPGFYTTEQLMSFFGSIRTNLPYDAAAMLASNGMAIQALLSRRILRRSTRKLKPGKYALYAEDRPVALVSYDQFTTPAPDGSDEEVQRKNFSYVMSLCS